MKSVYHSQKSAAKSRGIEFKFTYDEWCAWWETNLGPDWAKKRGCKRGQYVMARKKDKGPYTPGNVSCVLSEHNHVAYNIARHPSKGWSHPQLPKEIVIAIYFDTSSYDEIINHYKAQGVTKGKIYNIKTGRTYAKYTTSCG